MSKKAKEFFIQKQVQLLEWLAQSQDLNPTEHLWAILNQKAGKRCLENKKEPKILLQEAWLGLKLIQIRQRN